MTLSAENARFSERATSVAIIPASSTWSAVMGNALKSSSPNDHSLVSTSIVPCQLNHYLCRGIYS